MLSSIGSEYFAEDSGEFRLTSPGVDALAGSDIERPFVVDGPPAREVAGQAGETADQLPEELAEPTEIYSVYLFSSRSAEVSDSVNQRFRNAGYESQVYKVSAGAEIHYRVAVSGFPSRAAAQKFADSIVGRLGVSDTWIGRDAQ